VIALRRIFISLNKVEKIKEKKEVIRFFLIHRLEGITQKISIALIQLVLNLKDEAGSKTLNKLVIMFIDGLN